MSQQYDDEQQTFIKSLINDGEQPGWGKPGDNYYGGPCRRCGKRTSFPDRCCTVDAISYLQHLMDNQDVSGGTFVTANSLFALLQMMVFEKRALEERVKGLEDRFKSQTETINGMASALAEVRNLLFRPS